MSRLIQRLVDLPFWLRALPFLAVCAGLLFAGLRSQPIAQHFTQEDKLHHFVGFFALTLSCSLAFMNVKLRWIAFGCVLTGVLIELAQELEPLRSASAYDALSNSLGVAAGLLLTWYCTRKGK